MATKKPAKARKSAAKAAKKTATKAAAPTPAKAPSSAKADNIDAISGVQLTLTAELGRTRQTIGNVRSIGDQSLIELDKTVGEPVDLMLNGELFARGEVVTVSENFGVRIIEIVKPQGG